MKLVVLNAGGKDPAQEFPDFAGAVDASVHPPVNYHAYAACTGGSFQRETAAVPPGPVLLLLRKDLKAALKALQVLRAKGCYVAISWKESGLHQVAEQLDGAKSIELFKEICSSADGALSSTPDLVALYQASGASKAVFIPTPYPLEDHRWDFSVPMEQRAGVFIGTREFNVPSRNHFAAVMFACGLGVPVTVFNFEGRSARRKLLALGVSEIIEERLAYPDYLRVMARHRLVLQLDRSAVPGQVAGDALLCRMPCIGGNSATEQLVFPRINTLEELEPLALRLIHDPEFNRSFTAEALDHARAKLGFSVVAKKLEEFYL